MISLLYQNLELLWQNQKHCNVMEQILDIVFSLTEHQLLKETVNLLKKEKVWINE